MSIALTSRERAVLVRLGQDPDAFASVFHQRPDWLDELMDSPEVAQFLGGGGGQ